MKLCCTALAAVALLATAAACGGGGGDDGGGGPSGGQGGNTPLELVGVITEVSGSGADTKGFTLRTDEGETHVITLDPAIDYGFDYRLFEEYKASGNRVRVGVERRNNRLFATVILNA